MKKLLITTILMVAGCGGHFNDLRPGQVDEEIKPYVEQIKTWAAEYGNYTFANRVKFIDIFYEGTPEADAIIERCKKGYESYEEGEKKCFFPSDEVYAQTYNKVDERAIILSLTHFATSSKTGKMITLLHEFYHAVSDNHGLENQHIDETITTEDGQIFALSLMHNGSNENTEPFWPDYKDYYLRQLFSMRLDRITKVE
jgi:hypothetical protein